MARDNQVYYFDIAEGRWRGHFNFEITSLVGFLKTPMSIVERAQALLLYANELLPGETAMTGEILGDPDEGDGVARVEVSVFRFGLEVFRLVGHYALDPGGSDVAINVLQRFGPPGFPVVEAEPRHAVIDRGGYRATYRIRVFGDDWEGVYDLDQGRRTLDAVYHGRWGSIGESLRRAGRVVPEAPTERLHWERLLDLARELEALNREYDRTGDPRSTFAHVYSVITRNLADRLTSAGFADVEWVTRLAERFGGRFIDAMSDYDRGTAPPAWRRALETLMKGRLTAIDEFVLQMFVHIVHDLPRALLQVGLVNEDGASRITDFHRVNELLSDSINDLQHRLGFRYNILLLVADRVLSNYDETLSTYGIATGRALAWYNATRLADPDAKYQAIGAIDRSVAEFVEAMLGRSIGRRLTLRALRSGIRLFRRTPQHPRPLAVARSLRRKEPALAATYGLHTAVAARRGRADLGALRAALSTPELRAALGARAVAQLTELPSTTAWRAQLAELLEARPSARYALASVIGDLEDGAELTTALSGLGVSALEHRAIRDFSRAVMDMVDDAAAATEVTVRKAADTLDDLGIPATAALMAFDQVQSFYDPATRIFEATVPAVFRAPFSAL